MSNLVYKECPKHGQYIDGRTERDGTYLCLNPVCPACAKEQQNALHFIAAAIPPRFQGKTLDSYLPRNPSQKAAKSFVEAFLADLNGSMSKGTSALFYGGYGLGKSHLAAALCIEVQKRGYSARYVSVAAMFREIRSTWGSKPGAELDLIRAFQSVDLLVLDELGVQAGSDNEALLLTEVVNGRYERMKSTFILTNLDFQGIEKVLTPRVVDRLREGGGVAFKFEGESYRRNA